MRLRHDSTDEINACSSLSGEYLVHGFPLECIHVLLVRIGLGKLLIKNG